MDFLLFIYFTFGDDGVFILYFCNDGNLGVGTDDPLCGITSILLH